MLISAGTFSCRRAYCGQQSGWKPESTSHPSRAKAPGMGRGPPAQKLSYDSFHFEQTFFSPRMHDEQVWRPIDRTPSATLCARSAYPRARLYVRAAAMFIRPEFLSHTSGPAWPRLPASLRVPAPSLEIITCSPAPGPQRVDRQLRVRHRCGPSTSMGLDDQQLPTTQRRMLGGRGWAVSNYESEFAWD